MTRPDTYLGEHFLSALVHGLAIVVTPEGWRVTRRRRPIASGPESGARGFAKAREAAEGMK